MGNARGAARIVVVGGGIAGAFASYFLARVGAEVTLVEREEIGGQASGNNPGGLNPLYGAGIPGPLQELALEAFGLHLEHWDEIGSLSGLDFAGRRKSRLNLAFDDDDLAQLLRLKESYDATPGFSARWLEPDQLLSVEPRVNAAVVGGLRVEGDAKVDAGEYTRAVAAAARKLGATTVTAEVRGLQPRGDRVTEVLLDSAPMSCDGVVIATGPWCDDPARWLRLVLPVEPVKGEMLLVEASGGGVHTDIAWRDAAVYQADRARVWLGGSEARVGFDHRGSEAARRSILERVGRALPTLGHARVVHQTIGLRPVTPDGMPVIGAAGGWSNVWLVLGGGRKGMLFSAAMGRATADLVTDGGTELSIVPCSPRRFAAEPTTADTGR